MSVPLFRYMHVDIHPYLWHILVSPCLRSLCSRNMGVYGGIAQLVEQTAHIRSVIGSSPIAAKIN